MKEWVESGPNVFKSSVIDVVMPPLDAAYFVSGTDIGKFTMKTVDDPRTLDKTVHFRPPSNFLTVNELASLWEKKIGKKLPRAFIAEHELLRMAKGPIKHLPPSGLNRTL